VSTLFVLGGGGFLASHIAKHYKRRGWRVVSIGRSAGTETDADARHIWQLPHQGFAHLLAAEQPQVCVNASGPASVQGSALEPLIDFDASTTANFHILNDLRLRSPDTIYIHLSSAAVYGNPIQLPVREGAEIAPISPYGWHKRLSELVLEEYSTLFGLRTASLRIFSAYGEGLRRQVVWDLIGRIRAAGSQPVEVWGPPDDTRDFVHAVDVAAAVAAVVRRGALRGECYNVAYGRQVQIKELVELIASRCTGEITVRFTNVRPSGNPSRWHADIAKIRALGFIPEITLENGIDRVLRNLMTPRLGVSN
jgi:UDP-glucose 4-epimerase